MLAVRYEFVVKNWLCWCDTLNIELLQIHQQDDITPGSLSFMSLYSVGQGKYEQFITFKVVLVLLNHIHTNKTWLYEGIYTFMVKK